MKKGNDFIQFESRREIENLMLVIAKYIEQNPKEKDNEDLKQFYGYLDVMHMCW